MLVQEYNNHPIAGTFLLRFSLKRKKTAVSLSSQDAAENVHSPDTSKAGRK